LEGATRRQQGVKISKLSDEVFNQKIDIKAYGAFHWLLNAQHLEMLHAD